jgi:hypothetical protein
MSRKKIKNNKIKKPTKPKGDRSVSPRKIMQEMALQRRKKAATLALLEKLQAVGAKEPSEARTADVVAKMIDETEITPEPELKSEILG